MKRAIVIGGNHHNTLGLIRGLGRKGINVTLILEYLHPHNYILKSKYIKDYTIAKSENEIIETLLSQKSEIKGNKIVVVCCSDTSASLIDRNRNLLSPFFYLPGCEEQGRLTYLMNKETMANLAVECGLRVPSFTVIDSINNDLSRVQYPCITKPISSVEGCKADIVICQNEDELRSFLQRCHSKKIQAQLFIDKVMEYQLIGVINGDYLIPGRSRILTQPKSTNTGYLRYENLDGTEPLRQCVDFLKKTGYAGLFSMEFIRDSQGTDYFMEINFRNDGNSICVTEAGVNLPYIWYQLCCLPEFKISQVDSTIKEIYVIPEYSEIHFWLTHQIPLSRMVRELRQADVYMEYAQDDKAPTNGYLDFSNRLFLASIKRLIHLF